MKKPILTLNLAALATTIALAAVAQDSSPKPAVPEARVPANPTTTTPTSGASTAAPAPAPQPAPAVAPVEFDPSSLQPAMAQRLKAQWDLLGKVLEEQDPTKLSPTAADLAFSPSATLNAIQAIWWGTRGETALEIARLFQLDPAAPAPGNNAPAPAAPAVASGAALGGTLTLQSATSLWLDTHFPVNPSYITLLKSRGLGTAETVDWAKPEALAKLNQWASKSTNGKIPQVAKPGDFRNSPAFVVCSVLNFQAAWASAFDAAKSQSADFTLLDGTKRPTTYLSDTRNVRVAKLDKDTQLLELPFADGQHRLIAILPGQPGAAALREAESAVVAKQAEWQTQLASVNTRILLPKFNVTANISTKAALQALGVKSIFDDKTANFKGASNVEGLKLDAILQTATVSADEKGAAASAAATADVVPKGDIPSAEFIADRPFAFLILGEAGQPLFAGRVANPATTAK